jgi:Ni/Co efflux regulator RcnB
MKASLFFTCLFTAFFALSAAAQQGARTLTDENRKIRQGVRSKQLTRRETVQLKRQERKLRLEKRRFRANDGKIGPVERRKLRRDERKLDRNIFRQKHDRHRRV